MSKSAAFLKRSWPALAVAAVALALGAAALWELAGRQRESVAASAGVTNWGLSFQQEGQPPTANATADYLAQFDSVYCVPTEEKILYLTFDAGFENGNTEKILDALKKHGAKATFFLVGDWVDRYPESVKALHDAGMEVMNHSDDHAHFSKLSAQEIRDNVNACCDKIETITGQRPTLFRCPYGEYDDHVVSTINEMGIQVIQWDVDPLAAVGDMIHYK